MTPDDVAAIQHTMRTYRSDPVAKQILALCDAWEAAWIQCDDWKRHAESSDMLFGKERERAERADKRLEWSERDNRELRERAERAEAQRDVAVKQTESMAREVTKRGEALARVRALCEKFPDHPLIEMVRAAIDGPVGE